MKIYRFVVEKIPTRRSFLVYKKSGEKYNFFAKKVLTEPKESGIIGIPLRVGFFVVQGFAPKRLVSCLVREVHRPVLNTCSV